MVTSGGQRHWRVGRMFEALSKANCHPEEERRRIPLTGGVLRWILPLRGAQGQDDNSLFIGPQTFGTLYLASPTASSSACRDQTPRAKYHAAFVLLHNLDRGADEHKEDDGDGANDHEHCHGHSLPCQMARPTGQPRTSSPSSTGASGWNRCFLPTDTRASATWIAQALSLQRAIPLPG
jgi:hypothetical protein